MPLARASELDRLLECVGPAVLQGPLVEIKSPNAARAAMWGTMCHRWMETGIMPDNIVWAKPLAAKIKASGIDRARLWPVGGEHEVALAYNVVTKKAVRCAVPIGAAADYKDHWKAGFNDEWITGTLDYVGELMDAPWVDDLKTGKFVSVHDYAAQQAFYVLAWNLSKYQEVRDSRSTLTHWPHYPLEAPARRIGGVLDAEYLRNFQKRLSKLRDRVLRAKEKTPKLVEGGHCQWCPVRGVCPKLAGKEDTNTQKLNNEDASNEQL